MQNKQQGFSFIEILVVLLLTSILGTLAIPAFLINQKGAEKKEFIGKFTLLVKETLQAAIISKKVHQVYFNFEESYITTNIYNDQSNEQDIHKKFNPAATATNVTWPKNFTIKNFFINQEDEVKPGEKMDNAWFYIMPDGTSQSIIINIQQENETSTDYSNFSLSINPFYTQVREHESFQKP